MSGLSVVLDFALAEVIIAIHSNTAIMEEPPSILSTSGGVPHLSHQNRNRNDSIISSTDADAAANAAPQTIVYSRFETAVATSWPFSVPATLTSAPSNSSEAMNGTAIPEFHYYQDGDQLEWTSICVAVLLGTLIFVMVIGNVFVILAILFERDLRRPQYYLILSLAAADLMVGVIVSPLASVYEIEKSWQLGVGLCDFWISMDVLACTSSILHLVAIALDRYWSITDIVYSQKRTPTRIGIMLLIVWLLSLLISVAPMMGWKDSEFNSRVIDGGECLISQELSYQIFSTTAAFYAPLILIILVYWKIFKAARHRIRKGRQKRLSAAHTLTTSTLPMGNNKKHSSGSSNGAHQCLLDAAGGSNGGIDPPSMINNDGGYNRNSAVENPLMLGGGEGCFNSVSSAAAMSNSGELHHYQQQQQQQQQTTPPILSSSRFPKCGAGSFCEGENSGGGSTNYFRRQQRSCSTPNGGGMLMRVPSGQKKISLGALLSKPFNNQQHAAHQPASCRSSDRTTSLPIRKQSRESAEAKRERKAWRTLAIITGCFVGSWLPFFILAIARPVCAHVMADRKDTACQFNPIMASVFLWLGYLNSAVNPIIYTIFSPDFRQAFKRIIKRLCFIS